MRIFYLKADAKTETDQKVLRLSDVAKILCEDDCAQKKAQEIVVHTFADPAGAESGNAHSGKGARQGKEQGRARQSAQGKKRQEKVQREVIDVLRIIALLQAHFPGCRVESIGEAATVAEFHREVSRPLWEKIKIGLIAMLCFFGAAFTIMAFHNDISIENIFAEMYRLFTGKESSGFTVLEISYSLGLSAGIIVFFNHIGTRRITKDPTPIEVQMREYEGNVVTALVENAQRAAGGEEDDRAGRNGKARGAEENEESRAGQKEKPRGGGGGA